MEPAIPPILSNKQNSLREDCKHYPWEKGRFLDIYSEDNTTWSSMIGPDFGAQGGRLSPAERESYSTVVPVLLLYSAII